MAHAERALIAVVLAGGPADAVSALQPGAANKAFVRIGDVPLVQRVIAALRTVPAIDRIVAVAPPSTHDDPALAGADERRDDGARMIESLRSGLAGLPADTSVLVVASDLPVITGAAIEEFLTQLHERDLDVAYGCLERATHLAAYPQVPHTWARMRDGTFCGTGLVALKPRALASLAGFMDALGAARKSPLRLAGIFGWDVLVRFAFARLAIADAERRASAILGVPAGAIVCTHADVAVNVDRPSDVALADALVADGERTADASGR